MTRQKTGGRQKGTPNKATAEIREYAKQYTEAAISALVDIASDTEAPPQARISAANSLLDRAHGKPINYVPKFNPEDLTEFFNLT